MSKLAGKIALITGGSSGIGLSTAIKFVEEGAHVFITGRRQAELDKAVQEIGKNVTAVQGDVSNLDDLTRLYEVIKKEKGKLDIVIANAAAVELTTLAEATAAQFDQMFNVNARGTFFTVQKALPLMQEGGSIVLVSSIAHLMGTGGYTIYSATKAAMRSFARSFAGELISRKIRVNCLSPGPIDTPIIAAHYGDKADEIKEIFAGKVPMGRIGYAAEVAAGILYLASDDSSFSTGIDLVIDGGMSQI